MTPLQQISQILRQESRFAILSHRAPDGDTLGCAVALCRVLYQNSKSVVFLCNDVIPQKYRYLFSGVEFLLEKPEDIGEALKDRIVISVDVADEALLGDTLQPFADKIDICIDHHAQHTEFGNLIYREPKAAATGELVYKVIRQAKFVIDMQTAACLYTALSTDTGCFKYDNTGADTHRIAGDLIERGAPHGDIDRRMFDTISREKLKLQQLALETLEYHYDGKCTMILITRAMMEEAGAKGEDVEGISAIPRQIEGALLGITIRERKTGGYKLSLRSKPPVHSGEICSMLGGGGHAGAGGCVVDGTLAETKEEILQAVESYFTQHNLA